MTVGELQEILRYYRSDMPVVIEAAGIGVDDRSEIHGAELAIYEGLEEIHLVASREFRSRD